MKKFAEEQAHKLRHIAGRKLIAAFKDLYDKYGAEVVTDVATAMNLEWDECDKCLVETPTVKTKKESICVVCGSEKTIIKQIKQIT